MISIAPAKSAIRVMLLASYLLGMMSAQAQWLPANTHTSATSPYLLQSQQSSDPSERFMLAVAAYDRGSFKVAAKIFVELAKIGHAKSQYYMGVMHDAGVGVDIDHLLSAMWYQKAARQGVIEAQYNLAIAYANGEGIPSNMQKAIYWMKKSALGGNIDSQYNLGLIYITGDGVVKNIEQGIQWWRLAARNGDTTAQFNLGMLYLEGRGVKSDICEASRWWRLSADNGHVQSQMVLQTLQKSYPQHGCHDLISSN